jgi:flagellar hook assembly protein FlgD
MIVVSQMQNQDFNSTQDNGQFMAQIASMQAMQELTAAFMSSMSMSYMGKYAKAQAVTESGSTSKQEGFIDRVSFNGGEAMVLINETWFKVQDVYEVYLTEPEETETETGT